MSDIYDYLMENEFNIGTNFLHEFPETWIDEENGVIYLAKKTDLALYKISIEKV